MASGGQAVGTDCDVARLAAVGWVCAEHKQSPRDVPPLPDYLISD